MTVAEVLAQLEAERDDRGIQHWQKLGALTGGMRSYGIGLTRLRKMAKHLTTERLRSKLGMVA